MADKLRCLRLALGSPLLDLRPAESLLNIGQRRVPIHGVEELVHVALLHDQESALAVGNGLEEL